MDGNPIQESKQRVDPGVTNHPGVKEQSLLCKPPGVKAPGVKAHCVCRNPGVKAPGVTFHYVCRNPPGVTRCNHTGVTDCCVRKREGLAYILMEGLVGLVSYWDTDS